MVALSNHPSLKAIVTMSSKNQDINGFCVCPSMHYFFLLNITKMKLGSVVRNTTTITTKEKKEYAIKIHLFIL